RRRLPLGDVPRAVHPHEEERHATGTRALQGAEAVADGLVADPELPPQSLDVVPELFRRFEQPTVGADDGAGEIVAEADPRQRARLVARELRPAWEPLQFFVHLQERELRRDLERLLPRPEMARQMEYTVVRIVAAMHAVERTRLYERHAHIVPVRH